MFSVSRHHQRARQGFPKTRHGPVVYASYRRVLTLMSSKKALVPTPRWLDLMARFIETTEEVYSWEMQVAQMRREVLRNAIVQDTLQAVAIT